MKNLTGYQEATKEGKPEKEMPRLVQCFRYFQGGQRDCPSNSPL
jgi:hypothetical protein